MRERVRVAALQMNCRLGDRAANLDRAEELLSRVAGEVDIACFPELFNIGYDFGPLTEGLALRLAEPVPRQAHGQRGPTVERLCRLAGTAGVAIVGALVERDPSAADRLYDTAVLIDRNGAVRGRYRKSHLFPREHELFRSGDRLPVFDLDRVRVGVAICFEAAFPPIASTLALRGAHVIFNPSAVPLGYEHLQDVRTRARAQDNQVFVVAANHVGVEGEARYCGRSQIADPRGEILAVASEDQAEVVRAELDLGVIREQRRREPVFRGFRPDLYRFSKE
ncbi:MAG: carbon-nitrogen hydrolase family protein [Gemmatimonadota bacterium]